MKKTIFTLSLLLIAATLIFTGCSSKGDFELERSKGIKVTYMDYGKSKMEILLRMSEMILCDDVKMIV